MTILYIQLFACKLACKSDPLRWVIGV